MPSHERVRRARRTYYVDDDGYYYEDDYDYDYDGRDKEDNHNHDDPPSTALVRPSAVRDGRGHDRGRDRGRSPSQTRDRSRGQSRGQSRKRSRHRHHHRHHRHRDDSDDSNDTEEDRRSRSRSRDRDNHKRKRSRSLRERSIGALHRIKDVVEGKRGSDRGDSDSHDRDHDRRDQDRRDRRDRRDRHHDNHIPCLDNPQLRHATYSALVAAGVEAFRLRHAETTSSQAKLSRVATAALGAAVVDTASSKPVDEKTKRDMVKTTVAGLAMNHLVYGSRK